MADLSIIRNIGIAAHIDAGKTTTTERMLYYTGRVHRIGEVDEGTATMDWMIQEQERGITITSAATYCRWMDHNINIIDTPGHVDFTVEVERSLRVLDSMVAVFCGVAGVQTQSETVWRQADRYKIPRLAFINKMDRTGADFFKVIRRMNEVFNANAAPIQIPIGTAENFEGVVDLVDEQALVYEDDLGLDHTVVPIPEELRKQAAEWRQRLIEKVANTDEAVAEKYLAEQPVSAEMLHEAIRRQTIANNIIPVLCGSALRNRGIQPLMTAVVRYLPSPLDVPPIQGLNPKTEETITRKADPAEPMAALAFKITNDPYMGHLVYVRVYSGVLKAGAYVYNANKECRERVQRIVRMHANHREELEELGAGELGAVLGFKVTTTGDTLCKQDHAILLENIKFPEPVISTAIEARSIADQKKMVESLRKLGDEDPTFKLSINEDTGQTIIAGMGELHLEIIIDRLKREFGVTGQVGRPQVAYKETITRAVKSEGKYIRQTGGRGQYGHVVIELEPLPPGSGFEFVSRVVGGDVPKEYIPAIKSGIEEAMETGVLAGYPMIDVKVTLLDGSYHEVDSSDIAFKIAASMAFKDGVVKGLPVIKEPMMNVEVVAPETGTGDVISDINARRGRITHMEPSPGGMNAVRALVPLAELFGYSTDLRNKTQGRATYSMEFHSYQEVPASVSNMILGKSA